VEILEDGNKIKVSAPVVEKIRVVEIAGPERIIERIRIVEVEKEPVKVSPWVTPYPTWITPGPTWTTTGSLTGGTSGSLSNIGKL
jgi:hypothetical protein